LAVVIACFGTIGDLIQSKFKRKAQVKDSGTLLPGHGGIYDRLDSIIFVSPFVYTILQITYYVS
jgi:phosphatidate cytidylyltransferase